MAALPSVRVVSADRRKEIDEAVQEAFADLLKRKAAPAPVVTPPACSFCGGPKATQEIATGLRCQAETWHVCHRTSCNETIPYHRERLEAGLVDCGETRADTWRWTKERLGVK